MTERFEGKPAHITVETLSDFSDLLGKIAEEIAKSVEEEEEDVIE